MKKIYLLSILLFTVSLGWTQVGVNNTNPSAALDVTGDMKSDGSLFLERPLGNNNVRNAKLLIQTPSDAVIKYDIGVSKYGPINYVEFVFRELNADGLQDYDTKISTSKYIVTVQGYYFLGAAPSNTTNVLLYSTVDNDNIEGYQIYAYKNIATGTWFIRAFVNNSEFHRRRFGSWRSTRIDMYLNVVIYQNGFMAKEQNPISVDMGGLETGTAVLPNDGF